MTQEAYTYNREIPVREQVQIETDGHLSTEAPKPSNQIRHIGIQEVNRGYVVTVGCHTFAFETKESLIEKLTGYINNPQNTEDKWFKKELF